MKIRRTTQTELRVDSNDASDFSFFVTQLRVKNIFISEFFKIWI